MAGSDPQETTLIWTQGEPVELYTTSRALWLRAMARNPDFSRAVDLGPGYILRYPDSQVVAPHMAIKKGTRDPAYTAGVLDSYLTDAEKALRAERAERMNAMRAERGRS